MYRILVEVYKIARSHSATAKLIAGFMYLVSIYYLSTLCLMAKQVTNIVQLVFAKFNVIPHDLYELLTFQNVYQLSAAPKVVDITKRKPGELRYCNTVPFILLQN